MDSPINPHHCPDCEKAALILKLTDRLIALSQENADLKSFLNGILAAQESHRRTINSN